MSPTSFCSQRFLVKKKEKKGTRGRAKDVPNFSCQTIIITRRQGSERRQDTLVIKRKKETQKLLQHLFVSHKTQEKNGVKPRKTKGNIFTAKKHDKKKQSSLCLVHQ